VRTFSRTNQFKKDVKLAGKRGKDLARLKTVLDLLIDGEPLPSQYTKAILCVATLPAAATVMSNRTGF
jgi:mRNA-degrading endonuclease YafQ of YafQ-DinJ toxin-antitoxin module